MKKILHKLHTWLSIPLGVFITLICFSGAMLVFETEITERCRSEVFFVDNVEGAPLPVEQLLAKVSATLPDSVSVTGVNIPADPARTYQVTLSKPRRASVYVNPYTGEITGRYERLPFFDTMFHLHRWLLGKSDAAGGVSWGKLLVGISTLALVFILLTGLFIWFPRARRSLKRSLSITVRQGWFRFWYDLHVAGGMYVILFLLALALTGLTWSFSWYRTGFYGLFGVEVQDRGAHGPSDGRRAAAEGGRHGGAEGRHGQEGRRGGHGRPAGEECTDSSNIVARAEEPKAESRRQRPAEASRSEKRSAEAIDESAVKASEVSESETQARSAEAEGRGAHRHRGERPAEASLSEDTTAQAAPERSVAPRDGEGRPEGRRHGGRRGRHGGAEAADTTGVERLHEGRPAAEARPAQGDTLAESRPREERRGRQGRPAARKIEAESRPTADTLSALPLSEADNEPVLAPFAHWQEVYEQLVFSNPDYRQITVSDGTAQVALKSRNSLRATDRYTFDPATGRITDVVWYKDQDRSAKVRGWVYNVHVGNWGGMLMRILTFIAALLGATLPLTGYYLWIRRHGRNKQQKRRGRPDRG